MFAYETNANFHLFIARVGGNQPPTPKRKAENGKRKTIFLFPIPQPQKIAYERGNFVRYKALSAQHTWAYVSNSATEVRCKIHRSEQF